MSTLSSKNTDEQSDSLFASPIGDIAPFRFDQSVADVFPDMLRRSIPGYQSIIKQSGLLAARFAQKNTRLYDLGSSLCATSLAMREALPVDTTGCSIHAIDNSAAMIEKAAHIIKRQTGVAALSDEEFTTAVQQNSELPVNPIVQHLNDMQNVPIQNASVVALNFTLQFIAPAERAALMQQIAHGIKPGGALLLSEKVTFNDATLSKLHIDMYHDFKKANGYSELEISQKRTALENVLIPDTIETHTDRLSDAGFASISVWFQCFNFASIIAIKAS